MSAIFKIFENEIMIAFKVKIDIFTEAWSREAFYVDFI